MNPLPLVDGSLYISNSFLEWVERCSRGAQYYKLDSRTKADDAAATTFGSHIHSAMEMHYRLQEYNLSTDEIKSRVASMLSEAFLNEPTPEGDFRQLNWAMEIYERYSAKFEYENMDLMRYEEPRKCDKCDVMGLKHELVNKALVLNQLNEPCPWCNGTGLTSIMTEVPFVVPLFEHETDREWKLCDNMQEIQVIKEKLPVLYHGFIDLPVSLNNQIFTLDFKTTSMLGQGFWDDKKMSAQCKGYVHGFQETTGQTCAGYIVRAIRSTQPPKGVIEGKPNRSGEIKKLTDWWDESFTEEKYYLGEGELDEWKQNAIALVEEFLWHYSRGYFPKRTTACTTKYGRCQYFDVCSTFPTSDRSLILGSGLYKDKENPTPNKITK